MVTKELPHVVLENDTFRIVAKARTKQVQSFHAVHAVVDLNDDDENQDCIDLFAEMRHVDSMDKASWATCDFRVAQNSILSTQVRSAMKVETKSTVKPVKVKS